MLNEAFWAHKWISGDTIRLIQAQGPETNGKLKDIQIRFKKTSNAIEVP